MPRVDAYLVAGGKYHDINFARLELLKLMLPSFVLNTDSLSE